MNYQYIRYETDGGIATITLNRPGKLNAINGGMIRELLAVLDAVDQDDDVKVAIVTGEGRAFSAGADLSRGKDSFIKPGSDNLRQPDGTFDYQSEAARDDGGRLGLRLFDLMKPVIAAVNGPAFGLGVTMTLPMDIRLASDSARFGFVFAGRGMVQEGGSSYFLPRLVGISRALEWCFRAKTVGAGEALEAGLVTSTHAPDELLPAARRIARDIIESSAPVSVALIRQMMWRGLGMSHPMEAHRVESRGMLARARSADAAEGVASFLERRPPSFPDRVSKDMPDYFPWWEDPGYS